MRNKFGRYLRQQNANTFYHVPHIFFFLNWLISIIEKKKSITIFTDTDSTPLMVRNLLNFILHLFTVYYHLFLYKHSCSSKGSDSILMFIPLRVIHPFVLAALWLGMVSSQISFKNRPSCKSDPEILYLSTATRAGTDLCWRMSRASAQCLPTMRSKSAGSSGRSPQSTSAVRTKRTWLYLGKANTEEIPMEYCSKKKSTKYSQEGLKCIINTKNVISFINITPSLSCPRASLVGFFYQQT